MNVIGVVYIIVYRREINWRFPKCIFSLTPRRPACSRHRRHRPPPRRSCHRRRPNRRGHPKNKNELIFIFHN